MQKLIVTGAAGFIGKAISQRFRELGWEVIGVDLNPNPALAITGSNICQPGEWQQLAKGCDLVIHTAASVSNADKKQAAWEANVLATKNVVDAASQAGAELVHLSSIRAFSDLGFPDGVTEDFPVKPDGNSYVDTKIASEQVVLQAHAAGLIDARILRPGDVYGPGSRPWTIIPVTLIKQRQFILPDKGAGIFSPIYVTDLIDGIELAANSKKASGQVITISGGIEVSCAEFFGHYAKMLGKSKVPTAPTSLLVGLAWLKSTTLGLAHQSTESNPTAIRYFTRKSGYSIAKARTLLGFEPKVDLATGMQLTETWLRKQGLI